MPEANSPFIPIPPVIYLDGLLFRAGDDWYELKRLPGPPESVVKARKALWMPPLPGEADSPVSVSSDSPPPAGTAAGTSPP